MPFFYQSGQRIHPKDRVLLHREPGEIESVHDPISDPTDWYVTEFGGGIMVAEPKIFGRLFIEAPVSQYSDLEFVSRESIDVR